jgi:GlpG protein
MRLVGSFQKNKDARKFAYFLTKEGIKNQCDIPQKGDGSCNVWIINEDESSAAADIYEEFIQNPEKFQDYRPDILPPPPKPKPSEKLKVLKQYAPGKIVLGKVTAFFLFACIFLFIIKMLLPATAVPLATKPYPAVVYSSVYEHLAFDYPEALEVLSKLINAYGLEAIEDPNGLPPEAQLLLSQQYNLQLWPGFYNLFIDYLKFPEAGLSYSGPMFEKIKEGEVWRLFSPCLMHGDLFHLVFNMIWLIILGPALGLRIGKIRLIVLILLAGILSNTAQYLMSGPNFIGFSGVITGMVGFIWIRQLRFPWEGYPINTSTMNFMAFFVIAMMVLQVASFVMELRGYDQFSLGIANTAHIAGALVGMSLGLCRNFSLKK